MMESGASRPFFHLLQEYGLLGALLPELAYFLDNKEDNAFTLKLLGAIDAEIQKNDAPLPDRAILAAALVLPLFDRYLRERMKVEERAPHLGQIGTAAFHVIDCIFSPFFKMPRRLRAVMAFILTSQYRFIPLDGREIRHPRIPNDTLTPLALHLLKIRAAIQPELLPQYTLWTEAAFRAHSENPPEEPAEIEGERRPRRRRRRPRRSQ